MHSPRKEKCRVQNLLSESHEVLAPNLSLLPHFLPQETLPSPPDKILRHYEPKGRRQKNRAEKQNRRGQRTPKTHGEFAPVLLMDEGPSSCYNSLKREDARKGF